jgi:hypothetical protein
MTHSSTPPVYWGASIPSHWQSCNNFYFKLSETHVFPSQCGQDILVNILLHKIKRRHDVENLFWIDIGCNDGTTGSSTLLIEATHGKGLLVEPNYSLLPSVTASRISPVLCCCVSRNYGVVDLMVSDDVNTLSTICDGPTKTRLLRESKSNIYILPSPSLTLHDVVKYAHSLYVGSVFGFLKIDAEGVEYDLAEQLCSEPVKPLILEIENNYRDDSAASMLHCAGYNLVAVMDSFVEIWIQKDYANIASDQARLMSICLA